MSGRPWKRLLALSCGLFIGCATESASFRMASPPATDLGMPVGDTSGPVLRTGAKLATLGMPRLETSDQVRAGPALSLEQLLAWAAQNNPDIAVARAGAEAARGRLVQAGLYPNPTLAWVGSQILHKDNAAGEQGPLLTQQIVTNNKLRFDRAAAAHGVSAAEWQALTRWFDVVTRVRLAYYDVLTARAEVRANETVVQLAAGSLEAAEKLQKLGAGTQPDVLQARVEWNQGRQRLGLAQVRARSAWNFLALTVGLSDLPAGNLHDEAPPLQRWDWQTLVDATLTRSSEVQEARAKMLQAEDVLRRQIAERVPNLQVGVRPFYSFPDQDKRLYVEIGAALPLFNRNQGNIQAAEADVARARNEVRLVELKLTERLNAAYQRHQSALQQLESIQKEILPDAQESLRLIRLGFEQGDPKYDYQVLLQAQRTLAQAELTQVQALGESWRAMAEIEGLLQSAPQGTLPGRVHSR